MHQVINMRSGCPTRFGDADAQQEYEQKCADARKRQATRFAVAPLQSLTLPDGRLLPAGAPVRLEDFRGVVDVPAWRLLESAVARGVVLEAAFPTTPSAA
jgi:hypothetical protein